MGAEGFEGVSFGALAIVGDDKLDAALAGIGICFSNR
jgi:hypothetical protein